VDPIPDPLLLRKSGSAGNRTQDLRICQANALIISGHIFANSEFSGSTEEVHDYINELDHALYQLISTHEDT
jgi:hypothetical protein